MQATNGLLDLCLCRLLVTFATCLQGISQGKAQTKHETRGKYETGGHPRCSPAADCKGLGEILVPPCVLSLPLNTLLEMNKTALSSAVTPGFLVLTWGAVGSRIQGRIFT